MRRIAVVEKEKCNPQGCGSYKCLKVCPGNRAGRNTMTIGEDGKLEIEESLSQGCEVCANVCPFKAIHIINLPEALDQEPIHRYGKNGFSLFNLPTPLFGKVVGLLGINGIGKSSAIKILAGVMQANFGDARVKKLNIQRMIDHFKGSEAQVFFEKVRDGKIVVSYKPQNVDMIPKNTKGKVRDLLSKVDEKDMLEKIAEDMQITNILDNDITNISGGEIQRVAIAATVLKKANLYIFDEPTSYLDIKQRLRVSNYIRNLAEEDTAVLVIEHDLIALDYMTDLIHIMYGEAGAYGVVSKPKTTKEGINAFLEGYLKEHNVRFRNHKIKFEVRPPIEEKSSNILTEWSKITKKLGNFELETDEGSIYKNDVVGALGENGIGKTTFVKILANIEKPDSGNTGVESLKVSYKPQYIDSSSDELVSSVLTKTISDYTNELVKPLDLEPLFEKKINNLSGGELQRVAIAATLSKEADIVLFDEPSAHLDVEQRLIVSKVINNLIEIKGCSAIVVDHDLLFLDYLSRRLMVFDGEPQKKGMSHGPFDMEKGMNAMLGLLKITLRRDMHSGRPRINKEGSRKDQEQKNKGAFYYN